jgi:protein required for attachment to host cells
MRPAWVVVADSSSCRLFAAEKPVGPLQEFESFVHPEGRMHGRDLVSDQPGRAFDGKGAGRHAMEAQVSPKKHEAMMFAGLIAQRLAQGRAQRAFDRLVLVAPPAFLGVLRERLDRHVRARVAREVGKNMSRLKPAALRARLPRRLY